MSAEQEKALGNEQFKAQNYDKYVAHLERTGGDAETGMTHEQLQGAQYAAIHHGRAERAQRARTSSRGT